MELLPIGQSLIRTYSSPHTAHSDSLQNTILLTAALQSYVQIL
jgi:hypothetical protein